jgi:thiosulfate dehydrogenase
VGEKREKELVNALITTTKSVILLSLIFVACIIIMTFSLSGNFASSQYPEKTASTIAGNPSITAAPSGPIPRAIPPDVWKPPGSNSIPSGNRGDIIRYGKELIINTAKYLGPQGSVAHITNGMNCQNCHLSGGTKLFGNNFAGFMAGYPKFSGRNDKVESAAERIAECFDRSLNGKSPDTSGKEVQAILVYMKWLGKDVKKGQKLFGNAVEKLVYNSHAADPQKGRQVFVLRCQSCHGGNGEGMLSADKKSYLNPPLWGIHSYNDGAGMYRIINFAGFVKNNMPFGATYQSPQLTDEEAWNVAAFVNSQPRPNKDQRKDWKDLEKKPVDFPFGPYADTFNQKQHKFGPFGPIAAAQKKLTTN